MGGITLTMRDFSDWIRNHGLVDLPFRGANFTWSNMQENPVMYNWMDFLFRQIGWTCFQTVPRVLARASFGPLPPFALSRDGRLGSSSFPF